MIVEHDKKENIHRDGAHAVTHNKKTQLRKKRLKQLKRIEQTVDIPVPEPVVVPTPEPIIELSPKEQKALEALPRSRRKRKTTVKKRPASVVRANSTSPHLVPTPRQSRSAEGTTVQQFKAHNKPARTLTHTPQQIKVEVPEVTAITDEQEQPSVPRTTAFTLTRSGENRFNNPLASESIVNSEDEEYSFVEHVPRKADFKSPFSPTAEGKSTEEPLFQHPTYDGTPSTVKPVAKKVEEVKETHIVKEPTPEPTTEPIILKELEDLKPYFGDNIAGIVNGILTGIIDIEDLPIDNTAPGFDIVYGEDGFTESTNETNFVIQTTKPNAITYLMNTMIHNTNKMDVPEEKVINMITDTFVMSSDFNEGLKLLGGLYDAIVKQSN